MMAVRSTASSLLDRLPPVRGRYAENVPLAPHHLVPRRRAGRGDVPPGRRDDLAAFLAAKPADVPVTVIGVGSNLLVRDGGIPGVVVRLGRGFADVDAPTARHVVAGAGALDLNVARVGARRRHRRPRIPVRHPRHDRRRAADERRRLRRARSRTSWSTARAVDAAAASTMLQPAELGFAYRHCAVPADWIFVAARPARPRRTTGERSAGAWTRSAAARESTQPIRVAHRRLAPSPTRRGAKAWELIDRAGCRGLAIGGAKVSEKHCNFLINTGDATAADLESAGRGGAPPRARRRPA